MKLQRTFGSLAHEEEDPPDWPPDSDGSAKVALIGADRCLAAWEVVRKLLPQYGRLCHAHDFTDHQQGRRGKSRRFVEVFDGSYMNLFIG